ncbi:Gfo/Idh/MocA family oxidoreductase [Acholeplasma laidlawii]|uniref:Gfo/Idh/MocA family protein n=1 Tax=Acholeplasma laidlawii TaxID=2148 RepID=UPI0018C2C54F|nr:Gfo/Idh/MocA family oxidoreductase [Acholeplasma laidlawii]MBG0763178.1 Gfo/Idh/MocA family oxidoreductase [Acholeplasma laidlawii]
MRNIALVGVGNISNKYLSGLSKSSFNLVCLVDINTSPIGIKYYKDYPLYKTIKEATSHHKLDYVLISTPPNTHDVLIKEALDQNINVLVEKLISTNINTYQALIDLARRKGLVLETLYHWQFGDEVPLVKSLITKSIKEIVIHGEDPYCDMNGHVKSSYLNLGGALIDSLPNVLSFLSLIININQLEFKGRTDIKDSVSKQIVQTNLTYNVGDTIIKIHINWLSHKNHKETTILFDDDTSIYINHSIPLVKTESLTINLSNENRLETHYLNLFGSYESRKHHELHMHLIHKFLIDQIT